MKTMRLAYLVTTFLFLAATPAFGADTTGANSPFYGLAIAAGLGAGLTIIGAGWGFGRIGAAALESMARQPEIRGNIQTAMIVIAALLEGATFFALLVCLLVNGKLAGDRPF